MIGIFLKPEIPIKTLRDDLEVSCYLNELERKFWFSSLRRRGLLASNTKFRREEMMAQVSMTVNGKSVSGEVEGRTLLSTFLRENLELTGTHVGCDTSQCGACVVHVDGEAVKSCTMLALEAEGAEVGTIEGQANADGSLNVIQQAFQDHHGLQCGFCTPGMVMSAAALLKENPKPSEAEIRAYLEGNICRCTGYHNIVKAIMAASGQDAGAIAAE